MDLNTPADAIRAQLGIETSTPPFAVTAAALMNPQTGRRGAYVDKYGNLRAIGVGPMSKYVSEDFNSLDTADQVSVISAGPAAGGARAVTTNVLNHIYTPGGNIFGAFNIVQQDIAPSIVATGLDIGCDQTASDGMEIVSHCFGASGRPFCVGYDQGFYFLCKLLIADVSGINPLFVGFRQVEAANVTLGSYGTYAGIGWNTAANPAAIKLIGENDGTVHTNYPIDTTDTLADATAVTFGIFVNNSGSVSYTINGRAPTATGAALFDDGDQVIPIVHYLQSADLSDLVIQSWEAGLL